VLRLESMMSDCASPVRHAVCFEPGQNIRHDVIRINKPSFTGLCQTPINSLTGTLREANTNVDQDAS